MPMFQICREIFPSTKISVIVRPEFSVILEKNPNIDKIITRDKGSKYHGLNTSYKIIRQVRLEKFDSMLVLEHSILDSLIAKFVNIPNKITNCFSYLENKPLLLSSFFFKNTNHHKIIRDVKKSEIEGLVAFIHTVRKFYKKNSKASSAKKNPLSLSIQLEAEAKSKISEFLNSNNIQRPIIIDIYSNYYTKRWPLWFYSVLIRKLIKEYRSKILIVGNSTGNSINPKANSLERKLAKRLMQYIKIFQEPWVEENSYDLSGQLPLTELCALLPKAKLLIANDTSTISLAFASAIPSLVICGSTLFERGIPLISKKFRSLNSIRDTIEPLVITLQKDLPCHPCTIHGNHKCPLSHFQCMKSLLPKDVLIGVRQALTLT